MAAALPQVACTNRKLVQPNRKSANRILSECMSKKERELHERRTELRDQLPVLNHSETEFFNNSFKKNLCIGILEQGYHKSFAEIFALVKEQEENRIKAGPDSELWNKKLLAEEHEKLRQLEVNLVASEKALLKEDYLGAYQAHRTLAEYFSREGDNWLADHFFQNCLHLGESISQLDEGKTAADGHCNVGLSLQLAGKYEQAINHFELFYQLTKNRSDWITPDGEMLLHSKSCHCLTRIYTIMADRCESLGEWDVSLEYLEHAHELSKEGGDRRLCCEAGFRLGVAVHKAGDTRRALTYLQSYLDYCKSANDNAGIGKACEALAKVYDSEGNIEESVRYLENYIDVSEQHADDRTCINAYNRLGIRYNTQGKYGKAVEYFNKSYNLARTQNDLRIVNTSRVLSGIAQAHNTIFNYKQHINNPERPFISRLLEWKNTRADDFDRISESTTEKIYEDTSTLKSINTEQNGETTDAIEDSAMNIENEEAEDRSSDNCRQNNEDDIIR